MSKTYRTGILITGDASGAIRQIKLTDKELEELNRRKQTATTRAKALAAAWKTAAVAAATFGAAAVAAAAYLVGRIVSAQSRLIDETAKVADRLGFATDKLIAYRLQADLAGVAQGTFDMAMQRMVRRVAEAAQGTGEAVSALDELSLSAATLAKLSPDKQFDAISRALSEVESQGERVRLAFKLFDSEGVALVNMMRDGTAAAKEAAEFTEQWGLAVSRVDAAKVEQMNDELTKVREASQGFARQITVILAPAITAAARGVLDFAASWGTAGDQAKTVTSYIVRYAGFLMDVAHSVNVVWKEAAATLASWVATFVEGIAAIDRSVAAVLSKIPGKHVDPTEWIQNAAGALRASAEAEAEAAAKLAEQGKPSERWKATWQEWQDTAQEAAESVAASVSGPAAAYEDLADGVDDVTNAEIKRAEEAKRRSDTAIKTLLDLQFENQLLEREAQAIKEGETALAAFNRTKFIEQALRSESVSKLLPAERDLYETLIGQQYDLELAVRTGHESMRATQKQTTDEWADLWRETSERLGDSAVDMWRGFIDGSRDAMESVKKLFIDLLANMAHLSITRPIMVGMGLLPGTGAIASTAGGAGGAASSASSLMSLAGMGGNVGNALLAGTANLGSWLGTGNVFGQSVLNAGYGMAEFGGRFGLNGGQAMLAGSLATVGAGWAGGKAGTALGESLFGKQAESGWGAGVGAALGAFIPGLGPVLGSAIGGAIGGALDAAFGGDGKKRITLGVETDPNALASGRGMTGYQVRGASGLLYTGRQTRADSEAANTLADAFASTDYALTGLFRRLTGAELDMSGMHLVGGSGQAGKSTQDSGINSFFGSAGFDKLSEEALRGATDSFVRAFVQRANEVTGQALDLEPLYKLRGEGELLADALIRLDAQFVVANGSFAALGLKLYDTSVQGMALSDSLVKMAGGVDNLVAGTEAYYRNFYTEGERFNRVQRELAAGFESLGYQLPSTRMGVRDMVDSLDLLTESGQRAYTAILNSSDSLGEYYNLLEGQSNALADQARSVSSGFADLRERMLLDSLGDAQSQYNYFKSQYDSLSSLLPSLTDAEAIASVKNELLDLMSSSYNLLDEQTRKDKSTEFIRQLDEIEKASLEQLQRVQQQGDLSAESWQQNMNAATAKFSAELGKVLQGTGQDQQKILQLMDAAVRQFGTFVQGLPNNITITIHSPDIG